METLLNAKQVAVRLQVNLSTVYLWVEQGKLPHVDLARGTSRRCIRFRAHQLEEFLDGCENGGRSSGQLDRGARR